MKFIGNKFHSARSKEETIELSESPISEDRHLAVIPEKFGIIYLNIYNLGLYSKLN